MTQTGSNEEKNWRSKISLDCPFNIRPGQVYILWNKDVNYWLYTHSRDIDNLRTVRKFISRVNSFLICNLFYVFENMCCLQTSVELSDGSKCPDPDPCKIFKF